MYIFSKYHMQYCRLWPSGQAETDAANRRESSMEFSHQASKARRLSQDYLLVKAAG